MTNDDIFEFKISKDDLTLERLDKLINFKYPDLSRSFIKNLFENNLITSNSPKLELKKIPEIGTIVTITIPPPAPSSAEAEDIPLDIIFEDEFLLIVNKAAGMVVHPAPGNYTGTLVNALLYHCKDLKGVGNVQRPGIVHRLDKGTSGVMVVAKDQKTHEKLVDTFSKHTIHREYQALVIGNNIQASGNIKTTIGRNPNDRKKMKANIKNGKEAITHYHLIKEYDNYSHLKLKLETGRTHQIRVHLSQVLQHPILGDITYANVPQQLKRLPETLSQILASYPYPLLHAKILGFTHPITQKDLFFESELPPIFEKFL